MYFDIREAGTFLGDKAGPHCLIQPAHERSILLLIMSMSAEFQTKPFSALNSVPSCNVLTKTFFFNQTILWS